MNMLLPSVHTEADRLSMNDLESIVFPTCGVAVIKLGFKGHMYGDMSYE